MPASAIIVDALDACVGAAIALVIARAVARKFGDGEKAATVYIASTADNGPALHAKLAPTEGR